MDIMEFKAVFEWFLLRACFAALAALIVTVVCFKVYEQIGRLKAAAKRYGCPLVVLFIACSAWATYTAFPTSEEKNGNVANVQMLPVTNTNSQLGNGEDGTGNWELENGTGNIGNTGNIRKRSTHSTRLNNSVCSVSSVVENITATAQAILDARALYPDSSLADLYDPLTMPPELRKAHAANDRAVLAVYGLKPDTPEPEIVAHIFKLYAEKIEMNK